MNEPITQEDVLKKLKELRKELANLEENVSPYNNMPFREIQGLEYLKATEELKRRIELRGLIRKYESILMRDYYKKGTEPLVQDLSDFLNPPEFSWGINENEEVNREVIFEQSVEGKDPIKVTSYGSFRYLTGESDVSIKDIPDPNHIIIQAEHFLKYGDKVRIPAEEINRETRNHPEYFAERLNLLRISRGQGENQRDYFVLSPIQKFQLQDEAVRRFFEEVYCSDLYLHSVITGENGAYAGNIIKDQDGFCSIKYDKSSVRAAKIAEWVKGTTQMSVNISEGNNVNLIGPSETFKQIRDRFMAEIMRDRMESEIVE